MAWPGPGAWPRRFRAIRGLHVAFCDSGQQCRGGFRLPGTRAVGRNNHAPIRDGADRRLRARRLLDAYWLGAIRRGFCIYPPGRRRTLHADSMDQGNHPDHLADVRGDHDLRICGKSAIGIAAFGLAGTDSRLPENPPHHFLIWATKSR